MRRTILYLLLLLLSANVRGQQLLPYPTDTIKGKVYYKYTVEKSIGLYRISKNFGVTQEAILEANPVLRTRGLRYEEVILIPTDLPATPQTPKVEAPKPQKELPKPKVEVAQQKAEIIQPKAESHEPKVRIEGLFQQPAPQPIDTIATNEPADTVIASEPTDTILLSEMPDSLTEQTFTDTFRIAFLLPLQAEIAHRSTTMDRFYDFYAGALLALKHHDTTYTDTLGQAHRAYYEVQTHDVGKLGNTINQLMDSGALANMDAIIGPAYIKQVEVLDAYTEEHQIPMMIPFLPQLTPGRMSMNPYILKFNPSEQLQTHALMEHLDTLRGSINIVLVDAYADKTEYSSAIRSLRDSISSRGLPTTHTTIRQILADSISAALKDSVNNILLFHTERYSNIQLLMPYLLSGKKNKQLTILSQYAWQSERIILPQLYTSVFHQPEGEAYIGYEQDFAHYFGHKLSSTLPRYDLLGYDLTNYLLESLREGGFQPSDTTYHGIQSSILFAPNEHGGYENTHIIVQQP